MGNGDVRTLQDAKRMLDEVGADAVMVGRAALGNPWVLKQMSAYLEDGELIREPTPRARKIATAKLQLQRLVDLHGETSGRSGISDAGSLLREGNSRSAKTKAAVTWLIRRQRLITSLMILLNKLKSALANGKLKHKLAVFH